ncbi:hypothetical protein F2Q70_00045019 [Brassica cretica]|uniref:DYW domain-containing protein n=1 Tax=Brassica cretica TaxID=69181 RepID=A0A8S9KLH3_BRACR|nr:hypothetical protein F2Q70_00045019 [Brassica cretica]
MMRCLVSNGYGDEAISFFTRFKREGNKLDGETLQENRSFPTTVLVGNQSRLHNQSVKSVGKNVFSCSEIFKEIFSAYALTGDVKKGLIQFEAMQKDYGIKPSMEHYNNVTKMLATSGHLDEVLSFFEKMPVEPSVDVWETLMNFSRVHGDVELGDRCAELVEKLDDTRLDKVSSAGLVANVNYKYNRTKDIDTSRPETDMIYEMLESLQLQMLEMGYVPSTREWRNERVEKENKQEWTFGYKEEVAVVKKLLDSRPRSSVTVISNFRICQDSHDALKLMSEITGRQLIKRDSKKFHQFGKGICSCKLVS